MKLIPSLASIAFLSLLSNASSGQESTPIIAPPSLELPSEMAQLEFDFMVVQVPEKVALLLIPKLRDPKQAANASTKIIDLIAKNKAVLIGWPVFKTKSGQRAVFEQTEDIRFPTEFDPGGTTQRIEQTPPTSVNPSAPIVPVGPSETPPNEIKPDKIRTVITYSNAVPTSFETRNLGVTLEVEAVIGPDLRTIDLSLVPQHVSLLEMRKTMVEETKTGGKVVVEQPTFVTNKVTTSLSVQDGDYTLLGTFKVPKPEGYIELFILRTQIKKLALGDTQHEPQGGR